MTDQSATRIAQLEREIAIRDETIHNLRELLNDSDPDFYGDDLPLELQDENDLLEEIGHAI